MRRQAVGAGGGVRREDYFDYHWLETAVPSFVDYLIDVDGRPLAEGNAPQALKEGVVFDYKPCPYDAGRNGGRMNATALKQVALCWNGLLEDLLFLRSVFMRRYPVEMSYFLLARFADFLTSVPGFLVRTGALRWNAVPRSLSGLFKAAQGLYLTANAVILHGGAAAAFEPVSTDAFLAYTEEYRTYWVGDKVCSGPPALIQRFADLAINGSSDVSDGSWLAAHVRDDGAVDYAELKLKAQMARRVVEAWVEDALNSSQGRAEEPRAPALDALNRLSGFNLDESLIRDSHFSRAELDSLMTTFDGPRRVQISRFCACYVPLQFHYLGYIQKLQRQIDSALGRARDEPFCLVRHGEVLDYLQEDDQRRSLKDMIDMQKLAALVVGPW